jgi:hypothetical protein
MRPLQLHDAPSVQQVADAILQHYGPRTIGARTYDSAEDAKLARAVVAGRLLLAARYDVRAAVAAINALAMETALDSTDASGEPVVRIERRYEPPTNRVRAWEANPICFDCGERIAHPREAGALHNLTDPLRVAHVKRPGDSGSCFARALATLQSQLRAAQQNREDRPHA